MAHSHHHHPAPQSYTQAFQIGIALNVGFVIIEVGFGLWINSLALLADAGHNLSDVLGLVLAWGASYLGQRPPSQNYTYGWRRSSILAALLNSLILLMVMGGIAWEAVQQLQAPNPISGITLIIVAAIGVVINGITAWLFVGGKNQDLNLRAAFWHMAADTLVSLGVVLAGVGILWTRWFWLDPAISLAIVIIVVLGTWEVLKDAFHLSLDGVPPKIDPKAVRFFLSELSGVACLHDLHIWAMSTTETALTVHLVMPTGHPGDNFLHHVAEELQAHFNIAHATIQIEVDDSSQPCCLESDHRV